MSDDEGEGTKVQGVYKCTRRQGHKDERGRLEVSAQGLKWLGQASRAVELDYSGLLIATEPVQPGQILVRYQPTGERFLFCFTLDTAEGFKRMLRIRAARGSSSARPRPAPSQSRESSGEEEAAAPGEEPAAAPAAAPVFEGTVEQAFAKLTYGSEPNGPVEADFWSTPETVRTKGQVKGEWSLGKGPSIEDVQRALLTNRSSYMRVYNQEQKNKDIKINPWNENADGTAAWRLVYCSTSTPVGYTDFYDSLRWAHVRQGNRTHLCLCGSAQCPNATYGKEFRVETLFEWTQQDGGEVKVRFFGYLRFLKSPNFIMKGLISGNAEKGLEKSRDLFKKVSTKAVMEFRRAAKAKAKRSKKRAAEKEEEEEKEETPEVEVPNASIGEEGGRGGKAIPSFSLPEWPIVSPQIDIAKAAPIFGVLLLLLVFAMPVYRYHALDEEFRRLQGVDPDNAFGSCAAGLGAWKGKAESVRLRLRQSGTGGALPASLRLELAHRLNHYSGLLSRYRALVHAGSRGLDPMAFDTENTTSPPTSVEAARARRAPPSPTLAAATGGVARALEGYGGHAR
eukprot:Hpha_TRINITY_DN7867_c0_g1::TRINITY_DN7867_c0_g1_i1::g.185740::m.185740